jgi:predicted DNA-binding transcriptional regulator AlpA
MTENKRLIDLTKSELIDLITETFETELKKVSNLVNTKPSNSNSETELLNREETSKLLKISFTTLWKHTKNGLLPSKKLGNKVYYFKQDVFNYLNTAS